jgi:galactitol-specific phosphotransferase system IIB component
MEMNVKKILGDENIKATVPSTDVSSIKAGEYEIF